MKEITSLQNPLIKYAVSLHLKKYRDEHNSFIAQGMRTIKTIAPHAQLKELFVTPELLDEALSITDEAHITLITEEISKKISSLKTSSGILAIFEKPSIPSPDNLSSGLVLANVTDPGNMGTLLRTAVACANKSIVIIEGVDPYSPKVVQASAGTICSIALFEWSWQELIKHKKIHTLAALVVKDGTLLTKKISNALLVVGNEAHGINPDWLRDCDMQITLPMPGNTESLNAAIAGSIALYLNSVKL